MQKKVSVVIPIYNVEQYLTKCLDSVINQTHKNLEIICVNDCSTDSSVKILEDYAKKDERIKIVNRENNGGLSTARNSGLNKATGEYVYFIDSDDWIDLDYIEKMVQKIEEYNLDMVANTNITKESETNSEPFFWQRYTKKDKNGEFLDKISAINNSQCMIWCHLYRREFLTKNNLSFPEGYIHEDEYFQHISKNLIENLYIFYGPSYHYWQRQNSIMMSRKSKIEPYVKIFSLIYNFYRNNNLLNPNNRIKLFRLDSISNVDDEYDFNILKSYTNIISNDFEQERMASSDYEKYLYNKIKISNSYEEYRKNVGKIGNLSYLTREKILRNKNIKVSIIIPVYNTEKYLRRCLDSICSQTLEDIEIICINDCSTDGSLNILNEYAQKDNRIKIINFIENKGVAIARNTGIDEAQGEYISFVDADDYVDLDFFEKLYNKAIKTNSKLVVSNVQLETENLQKQNDYIINDILKKIKDQPLYYNQLFWLGLYNSNLIKSNSIKFIENCIYGEDRLLPLKAAYYAKKIETVYDTFYHYVRNSSSITKGLKNKKILQSFILSVKNIFEFINNIEISSNDYTCVSEVFLENSLSFMLELDVHLRKEFYESFKNKIFVLLDENKLINSNLYNDILKYINFDNFENLENFAKKYMNKLMFDCIRKNINPKRGVNV